MTERYLPSSSFLQALINADEPLISGDDAEVDLLRLISLIDDDDPANRDWATLLLSQAEIDTPEVRAALLHAAEDESQCVRAEAILGLAQRDKALALPKLQRELSIPCASLPIFEAAALIARPSLVGDLSVFAEPSGDSFLDDAALEALRACQAAERHGS
ncbi:MAG TPA: HEAT repeat domain-containing protein [Caulobacter sp.]|nr:HEAT repeat domain-containing protein [Caulobacter sp.]